jgi:DNA-directed RNA polymerase specialized sigma24 family protein
MEASSGTKLSAREKEEIVRLYRAGEKLIVIAEVLGCSEGSVQKWLRWARTRGVDLPPRRRGPKRNEDGRRL